MSNELLYIVSTQGTRDEYMKYEERVHEVQVYEE